MAWIDNEGKIHIDVSRSTTPILKPSFYRRRKIYCSDRSYLIAGILAVEFGFLGFHNFYTKYYKKATIQLIISIIAFIINNPLFFIIVFFGIWTWGIVEGILIFIGKIYKDGDDNDFWRNWFSQLTSAEYVRPYSYPHIKAWVISAIASLIYFATLLMPLIKKIVNSISILVSVVIVKQLII